VCSPSAYVSHRPGGKAPAAFLAETRILRSIALMRVPMRIRPVLRRVVPDWLRTVRGDLWRRRVELATARAWVATGGRVHTGPFRGVRYLETAYSQLGPKLLGTYEQELHRILRSWIERRPARLVNVGSGEGYYAVGFLSRLPTLEVVAFDLSPQARDLMRELASLNDVHARLEVRGSCTPETLAHALESDGDVPILMDVEGAERALLDPSSVPGLRKLEILVELHEFVEPGVTEELTTRFEGTHHVTRVPARERTGRTVPRIPGMSRRDVVLAAFERSAEGQEWLHLRPLAGFSRRAGTPARRGPRSLQGRNGPAANLRSRRVRPGR